MEGTEIIDNEKRLRFETKIGTEFGYIEYRWYKADIAFMHTFVPVNGRGKGSSSVLAKFALEYAKEKNLKIMVYCLFIAKYIKDHTEYSFLLDKKYHG